MIDSMLLRAVFCLAMAASLCPGELLRIEHSERSDLDGGKPFGPAGPYEKIAGKAYFAVDPKLPANQTIADVELAPRNAAGKVEFSADLLVYKPIDPAKGNGAVFFQVANRGGSGVGQAERDLLLAQGYMIVLLGWQFDVPPKAGLLRVYVPVLAGVKGEVKTQFVTDSGATSFNVADREHQPYPVVKAGDLTVRDRVIGPSTVIPPAKWSIEDRTRIVMKEGFQPGRIYEMTYISENPAVAGLGMAGIRDFISFLKNGGNGVTLLGDHRRYIKRAYAMGSSQSGRLLRTFVYDGFNADEKGRKVFDGLLVLVAGGGRGSFNHRFAQPSRDGNPFLNVLYPTDVAPFHDTPGGLLARAEKANVVPKIFYMNSAHEYWGRAAALIHSSVDGKSDIAPPPTTRIYFFAGGQHGPAAFPPPKGRAQNRPSPVPYRYALRPLMLAMDRWVKDGVEPPASAYPRLADGTLTTLEGLRFPKIAGVTVPQRPHHAYIDGKALPTLVPQVDADGNELAGVRMPEVAVPLAANTGWNLRTPEIGAPDEMFTHAGSWIPFSKMKLAQRYAGREEYLKKVEAAARDLVRAGYLLEEDVPKLVQHSAKEWDYVAGN